MKIPRGGVVFFDSGIGGLTVVAECRKRNTDYPFYYYGDNRHAPYGNLSTKKIEKYTLQAFRRLEKYQPIAAVVACNTVTAVCIEKLRAKYSFPIIGAEPAVRLAAKTGGEIFILSTRATYESNRFRRLCLRVEKEYPRAKLRAFPCDELAGEIERGLFHGEKDFSAFLPQGQPSIVVLGCTHYVYIRKQIEKYYRCPVLDGNEGIARRIKDVLERKNAFSNHQRPHDGEKGGKMQGNQGGIFFLGGRKNLNKRIYEQMFAIKMGESGQKNQIF